jgi:hypothetical protein
MSSDEDLESGTSYRTPVVLVIKTIVTHAFALASYAYVSNLLRRPVRSNIYALQVIFFAYVPTLPLVELSISAVRSLAQFIRNYDDDKVHLWYYICGALGMTATLSHSDDNEDTKSALNNLPLLQVGAISSS